MLVIDGVLQRVNNDDIENGTFNKWEGITTIGEYAFEDCLKLEKIDIPSTIKTIRPHAFHHCESLTTVTISDKTRNIGEYAFFKCKWLEYVKLPASLKVIKEYMFAECRKLIKIEMPLNIKTIENNAFEFCESLENINLGENIEKIGSYTFFSCENLKSISLPQSLTKLGEAALASCTSLKEIEIPENIRVIENATFNLCQNLRKIKLPETIEKIGGYAFANCTSLKSITIPNKVEELEYDLFSECKSLERVKLPKNLKRMRENVFYNCYKLKQIKLPDNILVIPKNAFHCCIGLENVTFSKNLQKIEILAFSSCKSLEELEFPASLRSIEARVFEGCTNLKKIKFNRYIDDIRYSSFNLCNLVEELICEDNEYNLNECKSIFLDGTKNIKSKIIKIASSLNAPYKINHNVKFPEFFLSTLKQEEIVKLLNKQNIKHFNNIYLDLIKGNEDFILQEDFRDFYILAYILGCFSNEEAIIEGKKVNVAQKASVFLRQIICDNYLSVADCHDLFDGLITEKYNIELLKFLSLQEKINGELVYENFNYLFSKGRAAGRIINNFDKVLKTIVTDKEGRVIKNASIKKRIETYLLCNIFDGVEIGNEDIANEFAKFPSIDQGHFDEAQRIRKNENYMRHIVGTPLKEETIIEKIEKIKKDIDNTFMDSKKLIDELYDLEFTYEWLDKHDPKNFTLGLYCDCCASIISAHYGHKIMRQSIECDNVQNMIIRNSNGNIIAKSTIYVNREKGYAVFNDIEMNRDYGDEMSQRDWSDNTQRIKIYKAFKRGVNAFVEKYNEKNKDNPITQVNIGWGFNRLKQVIKSFEVQSEEVLEVLESFQDARDEQWVVYKK